MDTVIRKISEIEAAATAIMDNANERKKAFSQEMEKRTADFDTELEAETSKRLKELLASMEITMNNQLEEQRSDSKELLEAMEQQYEEDHVKYVEELFQTMIKE